MTDSKALRLCISGFLLLVAIRFAPVARAQNANTGEIKGAVMDSSGAVVPGAAVAIKNVQTLILQRLNAEDRTQAVVAALQRGLAQL